MHSPVFDSSSARASQASRFTSRDIDLHAIFDISTGDHLADAATTSRDQGNFASHAEQFFDFHDLSPR